MYILNLEDNMYKHHDICKVLRGGRFGVVNIENVRNLEDGVERIEEQIESGHPYDCIITDMWYPERPGGGDAPSGEELIQMAKEKDWKIPIILCSSMNYRYPEIYGSVHYAKDEEWERDLLNLVKGLA